MTEVVVLATELFAFVEMMESLYDRRRVDMYVTHATGPAMRSTSLTNSGHNCARGQSTLAIRYTHVSVYDEEENTPHISNN